MSNETTDKAQYASYLCESLSNKRGSLGHKNKPAWAPVHRENWKEILRNKENEEAAESGAT